MFGPLDDWPDGYEGLKVEIFRTVPAGPQALPWPAWVRPNDRTRANFFRTLVQGTFGSRCQALFARLRPGVTVAKDEGPRCVNTPTLRCETEPDAPDSTSRTWGALAGCPLCRRAWSARLHQESRSKVRVAAYREGTVATDSPAPCGDLSPVDRRWSP